jgi:hypothetical protein
MRIREIAQSRVRYGYERLLVAMIEKFDVARFKFHNAQK